MKIRDIKIKDKKVGEQHDNMIIRDLSDGNYMVKLNNGLIKYYDKNGEFHREDGPAVLYSNGDKQWYRHGKLTNRDGSLIFD
jgi:hypothetical protein